jgi:predicted alpha/beta superfamily hydrolase
MRSYIKWSLSAWRCHSAALDEEREYAVALPASCDRSGTRRYSVLYVLDGERQFTGTARSTPRAAQASGRSNCERDGLISISWYRSEQMRSLWTIATAE